MSDKFVWTRVDTSLLLALWSDRSVQKNFQETPRNIAIWYGIARYMRKRGIDVNWLQCRQRMKRLLGRHRKIKMGAKLNLKNMTDSFYHQLDLVFKQNLLEDSILHSGSVNVKNETTTAVETILREPQLEMKERDNRRDLKSPTPKCDPARRQPSTRYMAKPSLPRPTSDECASDIDPSNIQSVKVALKTKGGPVPGNQDAKHLDGTSSIPIWYEYDVNSTNCDNPSKSGNKQKDPNCVTKQAVGNESDTTTKILLAQAETTRRLLEANRTQQERLESRMDQIVGQLEQMVPVPNQDITMKLETKLNSVLNKLDRIIPHTNVHPSEQLLHRKMEVVLDRLEHIIPCIEQYSVSAPNMVDKIDSLLTGIDKIAPYAFNLIEVTTEEQP